MNHLIVGYGEIGKAVHAIIGQAGVIDLDRQEDIPETVDVLHVCYPYSQNFVAELQRYIQGYVPSQIIIYSTLPIGITKGFPGAVHSPVEGKHPDLEMSIRQMERWIGANAPEEAHFFANLFSELGIRTKIVGNSDFTEALKLMSTAEYGVNIIFAAYKASVAEALSMDYELTKEWNIEYNRLYRNLGMDKRFQKFVLDAPEGVIGGHCIVPNANILNGQFPSALLEQILKQGGPE